MPALRLHLSATIIGVNRNFAYYTSTTSKWVPGGVGGGLALLFPLVVNLCNNSATLIGVLLY